MKAVARKHALLMRSAAQATHTSCPAKNRQKVEGEDLLLMARDVFSEKETAVVKDKVGMFCFGFPVTCLSPPHSALKRVLVCASVSFLGGSLHESCLLFLVYAVNCDPQIPSDRGS